MTGKVGVWLGALGGAPASATREAAVEIEGLGYHSLWIGEALAKEVFAHSALLLGCTERIGIGTGIANIWARNAYAMRAGACTLAEAYPGRFTLGLGVSHAPIVGSYAQAYEKPLTKMRTYLDEMDRDGFGGPRPDPEPTRVLAALRPKMLELARDRTAGAHPYFVPTSHTAKAREVLGTGPLLVPEQAVVLHTDPVRAREIARTHTSRYLALPNYVNNLRTLGFDDSDFGDGGSDRLVDSVVAWGDVDAIRSRVAEHVDAGADEVLLQPLAESGLGVDQLRELAPALL